ncbi:hypothetical protein ACXYTJ_07045 [Gilvimarinus sp. F26214L]|uniref:hypothetical protein n=1 Tax=Gilvimarinus sp. DZF01 TaxID=3461371 RepID=UPI00404586C6
MFTRTLHHIEIREPKSTYAVIQRSRRKQLARIICHLRDDLHVTYPRLAMPSRWLIENLLCNVPDEDLLQTESWDTLVVEILKKIRRLADASLNKEYEFTRCEDSGPLFPNAERFDQWDVFRFCQTLLRHLDRVLQQS